MTICFDTSILIWGIRGQASPGQEQMIERTRRYIAHLDSTRQRVMIPAPVLAEYLIGSGSNEARNNERQVIESRFQVPSLNAPSAQLAAEIQDADNVRRIRQSGAVDRQCLRTDAFIIAVAIIHSAERIISNDPNR